MVVMNPANANCKSPSYPSHTRTWSPRRRGMVLSPSHATFLGKRRTQVSVRVSVSRVTSTADTLSNPHRLALMISIRALTSNIAQSPFNRRLILLVLNHIIDIRQGAHFERLTVRVGFLFE